MSQKLDIIFYGYQNLTLLELEIFALFEKMGINNPIIHGGYLRDKFLNIPYADIDITVLSEEDIQQSSKITSFAFKDVTINRRKRPSLLHLPGARKVHVTLRDTEKIDFGAPRKPMSIEEFLSKFEAPINAIAINKRGEVFANKNFDRDIASRTYTAKPTIKGMVTAAKRYRKLKRKGAVRRLAFS